MSEIVFPPINNPPENGIIVFQAIVEGKTITCRITLEEMCREFMRGTTPTTFEEHFRKLRPEIEELMKEKILAKAAETQNDDAPDE